MTALKQISIMWSSFHLIILLTLLTRSRLPTRKTATLSVLFGLAIAVANHFLLGRFGPSQFMVFSFLCFFLPVLVYSFAISAYRDGRLFLTFFLAYGIYTDVLCMTNLIGKILPRGGYPMMLILRLFLFPLLVWTVWKWVRKPYLTVQRELEMDWTIPAVISGSLYLTLYLAWMASNTVVIDSPIFMAAFLLLTVMTPLIYWYIFSVVLQQRDLYQMRDRDRLLEAEAAALHSRVEQAESMEKQLDIQRHDLHHRFQTLDSILERGEYKAARAYLASSMETIAAAKIPRLCSDPVLDAVFASYFRMAQAEGISIKADLELPKDLTIDTAAFSIVVANALENAIHAVRDLPEEMREIHCKCIHVPQFIFRVSNPYAGEKRFDEEGRPIAGEGGHGIGTASIQAY